MHDCKVEAHMFKQSLREISPLSVMSYRFPKQKHWEKKKHKSLKVQLYFVPLKPKMKHDFPLHCRPLVIMAVGIMCGNSPLNCGFIPNFAFSTVKTKEQGEH